MTTRIGDETRRKILAGWPSLIAAVADGANIGKACDALGVTRDHVRIYQLENAAAREEWIQAREASADAFADMAREIADNPGTDSKAARVKLQALMWLAARRNPRLYSERSQIDVNVRTLDLTRIIQDANARLAAAQVGRIVDGQVLRAALPALEELL